MKTFLAIRMENKGKQRGCPPPRLRKQCLVAKDLYDRKNDKHSCHPLFLSSTNLCHRDCHN
jgi:hypothetical protein